MTIALYDALMSIGVDSVKAKAAAIAVCLAIDAKYDLAQQQRVTSKDLHLRRSDLKPFLNELKKDFIKWMLAATLLSIIFCFVLCKWIF